MKSQLDTKEYLFCSLVERQTVGKEGLEVDRGVTEDDEVVLGQEGAGAGKVAGPGKVGAGQNKEEPAATSAGDRVKLFLRLMSHNKPELPFILFGVLGSGIRILFICKCEYCQTCKCSCVRTVHPAVR